MSYVLTIRGVRTIFRDNPRELWEKVGRLQLRDWEYEIEEIDPEDVPTHKKRKYRRVKKDASHQEW